MKHNHSEIDGLIHIASQLEATYLEKALRLSGVVAFDTDRSRYIEAAGACREIIKQAIHMRDKPKQTWRDNPVIAWAFRNRNYLQRLLTA